MTVKARVEKGLTGPVLVLPPEVAHYPQFQPGREFSFPLEEAATAEAAGDVYSEEEFKAMLGRITPENRHAEIDFGPPVGKEIWEY